MPLFAQKQRICGFILVLALFLGAAVTEVQAQGGDSACPASSQQTGLFSYFPSFFEPFASLLEAHRYRPCYTPSCCGS